MAVEEGGGQTPPEIPPYFGEENQCVICGRKFAPGDFISHDGDTDKLVCYFDEEQIAYRPQNCLKEWQEHHKPKGSIISTMLFTGLEHPEETEGIRKYFGRKTQCDHCQRDFMWEDKIILINSEVKGTEPWLFCLPPVGGGTSLCLAKWAILHNRKVVSGMVVEFWGCAG